MKRVIKSLILAARLPLSCWRRCRRARTGSSRRGSGRRSAATSRTARPRSASAPAAWARGSSAAKSDFGCSPSFFGTKSDFGNNTVMDLMGNVIVGVPIGGTHGAGVRPYVVGGVGLIRTQIDGGTVATCLVEQHVRLERGRRRDGLLQRSRRPARRPAVPARRRAT